MRDPFTAKLDPQFSQDYCSLRKEEVPFRASDFPHSNGAWIGLRDKGDAGGTGAKRKGKGKSRKSGARPRWKYFTVEELNRRGFRRIAWDGRYVENPPIPCISCSPFCRDPLLIVDQDGRIIAVFVGKPDDPDWDENVIPGVAAAMEEALRDGVDDGVFSAENLTHRRGNFYTLTSGVSFGGGQKVKPGNLLNSRQRRRLLRRLLRNKYIKRIAGFQSSAYAYWAPKLYAEYVRDLKALFAHHDGLQHNFNNSIFPAVTFNCSSNAVSFEHTDYQNNPGGWCAITSAGSFDPCKSALFYMKQIKLMVEFPSGSTVCIPSGTISHGNTPLSLGETRYSMTQYAAGGLFRYVKYGFKTAKQLMAAKGGKALRESYDGGSGFSVGVRT
ncbi:hypothetical protein FB45DRAFT_761241 [Roridomyces roridus]|uniref:Uncharacterized protein n=1 Tax=Roridomyces roridus TaxID=1738132 RepID=A0AAD7B565_9AGAR|nr:hypothetical protein FB45DRAFT_761241 [Roridomyces roridus]